MAIPHIIPSSHLPVLHAIQKIILDSRPANSPHLPAVALRREWRDTAIRRLYDFAATSDEFVIIPDGLSHLLVIGEHSYRLMAVRQRKALAHVPARIRLRSNRHRWLAPAANQGSLFADRPDPGSEEMPVPLSFDPDGTLYVGWPDFVDSKGVGWGLQAAVAVAETPLHVPVEPIAAAPEEHLPDLIVPALKRVNLDD